MVVVAEVGGFDEAELPLLHHKSLEVLAQVAIHVDLNVHPHPC